MPWAEAHNAMGPHMGPHHGFGFPFPILFFFLFLIIAFLVIRRWKYRMHHHGHHGPFSHGSPMPFKAPFGGPDALEILRRRYASGEIDGPTFDTMRERLEASGSREPER